MYYILIVEYQMFGNDSSKLKLHFLKFREDQMSCPLSKNHVSFSVQKCRYTLRQIHPVVLSELYTL
jgi:hypothetical protein